MSNPFVGEIRMFGGNFAPAGWHMCDGSVLSIAENDVLFTLIGTTYGGDGQETFALPDLRGRIPIHQGQGLGGSEHAIGESAGTESVTLSVTQMPGHTHVLRGSTSIATPLAGPLGSETADTTASSATYDQPTSSNGLTPMSPLAVGGAGGSQPHNNMAPYLCVTFIISLFGIYPSRA